MKRPRGSPISDFTQKSDDPPAIKSALNAHIPSLGELMATSQADDLYQYIIEQKNGERILSRICAAIPEYEQAKDNCMEQIFTMLFIFVFTMFFMFVVAMLFIFVFAMLFTMFL